MARIDGRHNDQLREVKITPEPQSFAEGSVIIEVGQTRVLCSVTIEDSVPKFLKGSGQGWVTAEYSMLPRSTLTRSPRESRSDGPKGRTQEIQRLIGRSLRAAVDLDGLGERTLIVDCDVVQADGGTRTAAITGSYVAVSHAISRLAEDGGLSEVPLKYAIAATSVGLVDGEVLLDLCYKEDFKAAADFNIVMTDQGDFVEVQGAGEGEAFSPAVFEEALTVAESGIIQLLGAQKMALSDY